MATLPDILSEEFAADPYAAYRVLREEAPVHWHEGMQSFVISRYEDLVRIFKDPVFTTDNYAWQAEPIHGRTILQLSGREHAVRRALVTPAFRGGELQERFVPVIEAKARALVDEFRSEGKVELVDQFSRWLPIDVIVDMLGLDRADRDRFHRWLMDIAAFFVNLAQDPDIAAAGLRTKEEMTDYLLPIIAERRAEPRDDLISRLIQAEVDGTRMTDLDIRAFISLLLAAGGETTDKAIAGLFANLLAHPEQLAAVRADRSLIGAALAESLRYTPVLHVVIRQSTEDTELHGVAIPAGSTVLLMIGAANRDPERFADPGTFDIFRDDLTTTSAFSAAADHLGFALGRHFCVGAMLAKTEVEVGMNQLLDSMPDVRLADGAVAEERGLFLRAPEALSLEFTPVA